MSSLIYLLFPPRGHKPPPTLRDRLNPKPHLCLQRRRFPIPRYAKHPDMARPLCICSTPSSLHSNLKVSEHDSLWQPPAGLSDGGPRPQKSSRAHRPLNALTPVISCPMFGFHQSMDQVVSRTGRKMHHSLSSFAPKNSVSQDGFSCPAPRQAARSPHWAEFVAYICMVITDSGTWISRVRLSILLVVSRTGETYFPCPSLYHKNWSRGTVYRFGLHILHTQVESGAYSRDFSRFQNRFQKRRPFSHTDNRHRSVSSVSGPVVLKVVRVTDTAFASLRTNY